MTQGESTPAGRPGRGRALGVLGKAVVGALLVGLGCWRLWVCAFGPDEALLLAHKVRARSAAERAQFMKEVNRKLRESGRDPGDPPGQAEQLQRELEQEGEAQAKRDAARYRVERWAELAPAAFAVPLGLFWVGVGALWFTRQGRAKPGPSHGGG